MFIEHEGANGELFVLELRDELVQLDLSHPERVCVVVLGIFILPLSLPAGVAGAASRG
jgi:hypothetical protein